MAGKQLQDHVKYVQYFFALQLFQKDHLKSFPHLIHIKTPELIRAECSRPCS
jgi:hypothetical protein